MGKKPDGTPYVEYYISMLLGFCYGPVDELVQIVVKDKKLFENDESYANGVELHINEPEMFGGNLREGGLVGAITYMPGRAEQLSPESLSKRVGRTPETMPAFRGQAVLWFCGDENSGAKGFAVGCNMPSVPAIWARFRNRQNLIDNNHSVIGSGDGEKNSNPANMIYEAMVHKNLMNGLETQINRPMFNEVATTLEEEEFGMSLLWDGQSNVESFIQNILDHINAIMYFNPYTGLMDLKLLRDDYDPDTLPELGPDNCKLETFRRPLWGETINEIVVTWTNPKNEETESITYQDLANCAMQGEVVSETREFLGIRTRKIANKVCARELRAAAAPLASATIRVDRRVEKFLPGMLFKFIWPKRNIGQIILRVMEIEWGTVDDAEITLKCIEDVFALPYAEYLEPPETEWEPPELDPDVVMTEGVEYLFRATPMSIINRRAPKALGYEINDDLYNQIAINTYVLPTDEQFDVNYYFPHRPSVNTLGEEEWVSIGEKRVVGHTKLVGSIGQEVKTVIEIEETIGPGDWPEKGWLGMFLGEDEFTDELFTFEEHVGPNQWRIRRGILDTIPREWSGSTRIIIHPNNYNGYDWSPRFAGEVERYKFRIRTTEGISGFSDEVTTVRPDRPYRPYRPANVKIEATMFGKEDQSQYIDPLMPEVFNNTHLPREWEIHCTWSRRNRFAEDMTWLAWDDPDVPPEDGQTTEIILMTGQTEIARYTGLTGTSHTFNIMDDTARYTKLTLKFISRRPHPDIPEGIESLQGMEIDLDLYMKGFGSDWGYFWGGWPEGSALTDIEFDTEGYLPTSSVNVEN